MVNLTCISTPTKMQIGKNKIKLPLLTGNMTHENPKQSENNARTSKVSSAKS